MVGGHWSQLVRPPNIVWPAAQKGPRRMAGSWLDIMRCARYMCEEHQIQLGH